MDQKILREYLIALGFKIDEGGERKTDALMTRLDKKAMALSKSLLGVAVTVTVAATAFARQMEKMYYSSRYADTTVGNLQALEYGARNIGLEAGQASGALKNMAAAIRGNPGLIGLLNSLGVEVQGRDKADVMMDLVEALKRFPPYIAQQYAGLFGIDPETLFNLQQGLDKLREAGVERKRMAEEMGFDADRAAQVGREYMTLWREVTERAKLFAYVVGEAALPYVQEMVKETDKLLIKWSAIVREIKDYGSADFLKRLREGVAGAAEGERVTLSKESKERLGLPERTPEPTMHVPGEDVRGTPGWFTKKAQESINRWLSWRTQRGEVKSGAKPRAAGDVSSVDAATDLSDFKTKQQRTVTAEGEQGPDGRSANEESDTQAMPPEQKPPIVNVAGAKPPVVNVAPGKAPPAPVVKLAGPGWSQPKAPAVHVNVEPPQQEEVDADGTRWSKPQDEFDPQRYMATLEKKYALPRGLLDRVWNRESARGDPKQMLSPKNAKGHFGFIPKTAEAYGVKGKENDFKASAEASAHMWADLLQQYQGDVRKAAAAYNWGSGKLERFGLGAAPRETREYMDAVAGPVNVEAKPEIHIHGVTNPQEAADRVIREQRSVNADITRNFSPKVR